MINVIRRKLIGGYKRSLFLVILKCKPYVKSKRGESICISIKPNSTKVGVKSVFVISYLECIDLTLL